MHLPRSAEIDRRSFLRTMAATAAAGIPLVGRSEGSGALKLALISAATYGTAGAPRTPGSNHGTAFATTFNGWDEEKAKLFRGTFVRSGRRLDAARVVKIWDPDKTAAQALADVCGIAMVTDSPEECSEGVDAVLIIDDGSGQQWKYAEHPLRKGVPTFCDKPLAMTAKEAASVAKLVRQTRTRFMWQ